MRIYVGNFAYEVTDQELRKAFEAHGTVSEVTLIRDRDTDRPKGFGFVEMPTASEAQAAIAGLNGKELHGRAITVNEAKPRVAGGGYGGGGFGGRSSGGGGYGSDRRDDSRGGRGPRY